MPKWPVANGDSNTQQGDSATPTLVDLYLKGFLTPQEAAAAYAAMLHNAEATPPSSSQFAGRPYLDAYTNVGWVPFVFPTSFPSGPSGGAGYATLFAASATQEYALDDCDLAQMAASLGDNADRAMLAMRSTHWRDLFDSATGFVRPRTATGAFESPFNPALSNVGFEEGSAWEYLWFEPGDVAGLIDRLGGPAATNAKLDQLFQFAELVASPKAVAASQQAAGAAALVLYDPQYNPDNEPDIQVPYMYLYTGSAWKTQVVVRAEETTYNTTPAGLPGNDDLGTMSAWYVLSAMGVYPMTYGLPVWGLTTPEFDKVTVSLERPWYTHPTLTISAPGASGSAQYIQSATLDGVPLDRAWVDHKQLDGAYLRLRVGASPQQSWGATSPPPSPCSGANGLGGSASVTPSRSAR
jgi:predicted alpha-1,2-mannosidase